MTTFQPTNKMMSRYSCAPRLQKSYVTLIALSSLLAAGSAHAQTADASAADKPATADAAAGSGAAASAPASPISGSLTLASQYISRGVRQTWGNPAIQGSVTYTAANGLFAGIWGSNVSGKLIENGNLELDLYGGYGSNVGDINYSTSLFYYVYPGARMSASGTKYNYGEFVVSGGYKWLTLKYSLTVTRDYFGDNSATLGEGNNRHSRGSGYFDAALDIPLGNDFNLHLHYGNQRVRNFSHYDFQDIEASLIKNFSAGWSVKAGVTSAHNSHGAYAHYTTGIPNANGQISTSNPLQTTVFVTLTKNF